MNALCEDVEIRGTFLAMNARDPFSVLSRDISTSDKFNIHVLKQSSTDSTQPAISDALDDLNSDVIGVNGWSLPGSTEALSWAVRRGRPAIVFSESNEFDSRRYWPRELLKKVILKGFSCAMVGGQSHRRYLRSLGFPDNRIFDGYDVVANEHFSMEGAQSRVTNFLKEKGLPKRYFLTCSRFALKKNLETTINAFHRYRASSKEVEPCELVIIGSGETEGRLRQAVQRNGILDVTHFVGAVPYEELPAYYASATAFIHASTVEQWGLVVNEAMASGLPVLVSRTCGCAEDLVEEGANGFTFDPLDAETAAKALAEISKNEELRQRMSRRSKEIIRHWSPARFAHGCRAAIHQALNGYEPLGFRTLAFIRILAWRR